MWKPSRYLVALWMLAGALGPWTPAEVNASPADRLTVRGDFRLRLESDFDSRQADGTEREDRTRVRARVRVGVQFKPSDRVRLGLRLRSGSDLSHQSPHVTLLDFDDNDTGDADFNLDQWFVRAESGSVWGWAGRNGFPFWKQNELLWDDDATVAGLAGGIKRKAGDSGTIAINAAYLSPPVGMREFSGELAGGQVVYSRPAAQLGFTAAAGLFDYRAADPARDADGMLLRNGNGLRDYRVTVASFQGELIARGRPLVLGLDYLHNGKHYTATDPDPFTAANRDQTDGVVVALRYGSVQERGDWQLAHVYARIETLAVIASYAQDDWVRWGSATETDGSDLKGHELRFTYGLSGKSSLMARLYRVDAVTTVQDGKRLRLDFNHAF